LSPFVLTQSKRPFSFHIIIRFKWVRFMS